MIATSNNDVKTIRLHSSDNVVIALQDLSAGTELPDITSPLADGIRRGHKIAATPIAQGKNIIRYGQVIGVAAERIEPGQHVHTHNMVMGKHDLDYAFSSDINKIEPAKVPRAFMGYHRHDGRVGTRKSGNSHIGKLLRQCGKDYCPGCRAAIVVE